MSRPTYERPEHLANEESIKKKIEQMHNIKLHKSPKYYHIDYFVTRPTSNKVIGWVEIRGKQFAKHCFPTFYTSVEKFISVSRMGHMTGKPAYIVATWTDWAGFYQCDWKDTREFDIRLGGRTRNSRGDDQDIEVVIDIPVEKFSDIAEMKFND